MISASIGVASTSTEETTGTASRREYIGGGGASESS
jgi:hypothetical protein